MTQWEKFFDQKIRAIAKAEIILDIGGGLKLEKGLNPYKELFAKTKYIVLDKEPAYTPDVVGDIHDLPFKNETFDGVICKAVLEHVEDPVKAAGEIYRVLKKKGQCFLYLPFIYPYHAQQGVYKDYYRFTEDAIYFLFKRFKRIEICPVRGFFETLVYFSPFKLLRRLLSPPARWLDSLLPDTKVTSGFHIYLIK